MTIQIKFATSDDRNEILKYENYLEEKRLNQILENREILLAYDNEKNIGYLRYQLFWTRLPYVTLIFVNSEYRKKGVGKKLLEYLENHLRKLGYKRLLSSSTANEPNPNEWHQKVGFREVGKVSELNENKIGEIFYLKDL